MHHMCITHAMFNVQGMHHTCMSRMFYLNYYWQ